MGWQWIREWFWSSYQSSPLKRLLWWAAMVLAALVVIGTIANLLVERSSSDSEIRDARDLFNGCMSSDGNHDGLESLIRTVLHDPGSMETHRTYYNSSDSIADGEIRIRLNYSAANVFGGKVRKNAWARMGLDCQIIAVTDYGS